MPDFKAKLHQITPNSISAGAPPQTPLGELTALPRGSTSKRRGGEGEESVTWGGEGKGGERRGGEQGRREGEGRLPNVRDALTPL